MNLARLLSTWLLVVGLMFLGTLTTPVSAPTARHGGSRRPAPRSSTRARVAHVAKTGPLHVVVSRKRERLKVFTPAGRMIYTCRAKNDAICLGFWRYGACPPGAYGLAVPIRRNTPAYGPYFVGLLDLSAAGPFHRYRRHGIGLHGGGSGLCHPLAAFQGWEKTLGCLRLENHDLVSLVHLTQTTQRHGYHCYLTVSD